MNAARWATDASRCVRIDPQAGALLDDGILYPRLSGYARQLRCGMRIRFWRAQSQDADADANAALAAVLAGTTAAIAVLALRRKATRNLPHRPEPS